LCCLLWSHFYLLS